MKDGVIQYGEKIGIQVRFCNIKIGLIFCTSLNLFINNGSTIFFVYVKTDEGKGIDSWSEPVATKNWNTSKFLNIIRWLNHQNARYTQHQPCDI